MLKTNLIEWHCTADRLPDSDMVVLRYSPDACEKVWPGYHDGECWRDLEGNKSPGTVQAWAELPEGPQFDDWPRWRKAYGPVRTMEELGQRALRQAIGDPEESRKDLSNANTEG